MHTKLKWAAVIGFLSFAGLQFTGPPWTNPFFAETHTFWLESMAIKNGRVPGTTASNYVAGKNNEQ